MRQDTRLKFNAYLQQIAQVYGVSDVDKRFNVTPNQAEKVRVKLREQNPFLAMINFVGVDNQQGQVIGMDTGVPIASTTDTTQNDRRPIDPSTLDYINEYHCQQINFDTAVRYDKLDQWSHLPNFQSMLQSTVIRQQGLDITMIGWNGVARSKNSDRTQNKMLQDVSKGWLQKIRDINNDSENGKVTMMKDIKVGDVTGADYQNIDAAVMDAKNELIAEWYQQDPELIVIMGRHLMNDKYLALTNISGNDALGHNALDVAVLNRTFGGLKAYAVPYFPANAFLIVKARNLSIYAQNGSRRRKLLDNAQRDQYEDYNSENLDYVIEDYDCAAFVENILQPSKQSDGSIIWE